MDHRLSTEFSRIYFVVDIGRCTPRVLIRKRKANWHWHNFSLKFFFQVGKAKSENGIDSNSNNREKNSMKNSTAIKMIYFRLYTLCVVHLPWKPKPKSLIVNRFECFSHRWNGQRHYSFGCACTYFVPHKAMLFFPYISNHMNASQQCFFHFVWLYSVHSLQSDTTNSQRSFYYIFIHFE